MVFSVLWRDGARSRCELLVTIGRCRGARLALSHRHPETSDDMHAGVEAIGAKSCKSSLTPAVDCPRPARIVKRHTS